MKKEPIKYELDKGDYSKHWKDLRVGWRRWKMTFVCRECHKNVTEGICGTEEEVEEYCNDPNTKLCTACANT